MSVRPDLWSAYLQTRYTVNDSPLGPFCILAGERNPKADEVCRSLSVSSWAYITASNPRSVPLCESENATRLENLMRELEAHALPYFEGKGINPDESWEPEESLFVPGISRALAIRLGSMFDQYAILFAELGNAAELIECPLAE